MTKEQKTIKNLTGLLRQRNEKQVQITTYDLFENIETVLNMIKERDKEVENLKENIDYQTLCDFLISSVSEEEKPVWTEEHIEELLENFEVRWKDAYKQDS